VAPAARGGLVSCPRDGADSDALLSGARRAAVSATPGQLADLSEATHALDLGERRVIAVDPMMTRLFALVSKLARSELPILITGETGVGKEIVATALHRWSARRERPLLSLNCAAIAESLLESELFGHEQGAFSGAVGAKPGLLESASGGTVFLDEVGECSLRAQAELLRVLETKRARRVGALSERPVDVRIIAATNRDLSAEIAGGGFRRDLFYRLSAASIAVPPLRDRALDIPVLARSFLEQACRELGRPPLEIAPAAMQRLALHDWPGNVRELKNLAEYLASVVEGSQVEPPHLPPQLGASAASWLASEGEAQPAPAPPPATAKPAPRTFRPLYQEIRELEELRIREALEATGGVRVRAAELLGLPLRTLVTKLKQYGLSRHP